MGIFDNVNMQQLMPMLMGGMAAGAAYGDPASGPMLAHGGWNAVQQYMQQQRMQQQKEEFEQRQKQLDKELGMREKYLKIAEDKAAQENEAELEDEYIATRFPSLFDIASKGGGVSEMYRDLQENAPPGLKINASRFIGMVNSSKFFDTKEGRVLARYDEKTGGLSFVQEKTTGGKKTYETINFAEGMPLDVLEKFSDSPEMLRGAARQARDQKQPGIAAALESQAKEVEKKKKDIDYQGLNYAHKVMVDRQKAEDEELEARIGKRDSSGLYSKPLDPNNPEADEAARDAAWVKLREKQRRERAGAAVAQAESSVGAKEKEKQLKKAADPYPVSEEDMPTYTMLLEMYAANEEMSYDEKVAGARAALELMKKSRKEVSKKPAEGSKKPVSAPVPRMPGQPQIGPAGPQKFDWGTVLPFGGMGMNQLGAATDQSLEYMRKMMTPTQRPPRGWQGY